MKNIASWTKRQCSGCGACISVCAASAIRLDVNPLGYYQAYVDENKCLSCGLCQNVCARFTEETAGAHIRKSRFFALRSSRPETVKRCSSGGAAHEIALAADLRLLKDAPPAEPRMRLPFGRWRMTTFSAGRYMIWKQILSGT